MRGLRELLPSRRSTWGSICRQFTDRGKLIELLRGMFDYILVDLPPVTVVADALAVSGVLDGMLVVVGEGVVSKHELADAMQRLDIIRDKILGFAVTHSGSKRKNQYGYTARN